MKFTKRIFLILIACAITTNICAIQFRHLSIKDGLSQLSVLSIYQDKLGRMWFGTEEGINVFDGNNLTAIKTLRNIPPQNLEVRWICGDEKGNIYFQLGTSIVCIDFATQSNTVLVKKVLPHYATIRARFITQVVAAYTYTTLPSNLHTAWGNLQKTISKCCI